MEDQRWQTALDTLRATGQAPVQAHLAAARLRFAARISVHGTPAIRGLAQSWSGAGWRRALGRDMQLMQRTLRALEHVERGSKVCRAAVLEGGLAPQPPEVVAAADAADKAWRRQARLSGVPQLAGPPAIVKRPLVAAVAPGPAGP